MNITTNPREWAQAMIDMNPQGLGGRMLTDLLAELAQQRAAIERVRELHTKNEDGPYCSTCGPNYHTICCDESAWPCPTIVAFGDSRPTEQGEDEIERRYRLYDEGRRKYEAWRAALDGES
jgi:hypothetical protein